ncbi:MAG: S-layer homology domain-containing protein [Thermoclostridium sp.]|nr:S-layer homology domain-containing protein [Thermoclostridium sp.]
MRKMKLAAAMICLCSIVITNVGVYAYTGSMGYEGGISAADPYVSNTYQYREACFLTGSPIILEGTMTVKKNVRQGKINTTYTYNLANAQQNATLTRVVVMDTITETKENGQTTETSTITKRPTENIKVGDIIFSLTDYQFSRSGINDPKPAVLYNVGEYQLTKTYSIIGSKGTITLEMTGTQYGFDQYWGSTKSGTVNLIISASLEGSPTWGGLAQVVVSSTAKKGFRYVENQPWQISFEGGYVEQDWEESVLEYNATLPEFDKNGNATEVLKDYQQRLGLETEPVNTRLMVPDLKHLKGHWAEESAKILFSMEVIPGNGENFNPAQYVKRSEYIAMVVRAIKDIPVDPDLITRTVSTTRSKSSAAEVSPFSDVAPEDKFYSEIKAASIKGITLGTGQTMFTPDRIITTAEAVTILIRALGLEGLAPSNAVTPFIDNDDIPAYARNATTVAYRIGLVQGDNRGYFKPQESLTWERASAVVYRLIRYMGEDLVRDYQNQSTWAKVP